MPTLQAGVIHGARTVSISMAGSDGLSYSEMDMVKIEIAPLKAKILLGLLKSEEIREIAIKHYALDNLDELIEALEVAEAEGKSE